EVNGVVGNNFLGFDRKLVIASADTELLEPLVRRRMEDHYPTFLDRMTREGPDISYMKINPSGTPFYGFNVTAAETQHSVRNFAYRFDDPKTGKSFAISGDGSFTDATRELFKGVDLLMHEGFYVDQSTSNHASIRDIVDYAIEFGVPKVSVVHVNREERQNTSGISDLIALGEKNGVKVDVPNDYDVITV
ncbi:MAG: MBL fold metallo-hydrolase, partial [Candidatus Nanoarchaeia archaeon]